MPCEPLKRMGQVSYVRWHRVQDVLNDKICYCVVLLVIKKKTTQKYLYTHLYRKRLAVYTEIVSRGYFWTVGLEISLNPFSLLDFFLKQWAGFYFLKNH